MKQYPHILLPEAFTLSVTGVPKGLKKKNPKNIHQKGAEVEANNFFNILEEFKDLQASMCTHFFQLKVKVDRLSEKKQFKPFHTGIAVTAQ